MATYCNISGMLCCVGDVEGGEGEGGEENAGGKEEGREDKSAPPSRPLSPSLSGITSVAQLEALMRVHIMMAQVHGPGSQEHWDHSMTALACCSLVWKAGGSVTI